MISVNFLTPMPHKSCCFYIGFRQTPTLTSFSRTTDDFFSYNWKHRQKRCQGQSWRRELECFSVVLLRAPGLLPDVSVTEGKAEEGCLPTLSFLMESVWGAASMEDALNQVHKCGFKFGSIVCLSRKTNAVPPSSLSIFLLHRLVPFNNLRLSKSQKY